ncbi:zinc metallopeptidase [bacterium]|nr:zinc metallopeptidase [bacterium]
MLFPVFNINYLIYMLPAFIIGLIAQLMVRGSFSRWSQVPNRTGLSGTQVAQRLADHMGLYGMQLKGTPGQLTDHYDPRSNTLSLSRDIAQGNSVAAMAITAHELGHAQQDQEEYLPMKIRSTLVPVVNFGTKAGWIMIFLGLILQISNLAWLGVFAFSAGAVFSIATLPVELNASKRARQLLQTNGMITTEEEQRGVNQVLNAAALTYIAAIATSVLQLMYFASLAGGGRRRR